MSAQPIHSFRSEPLFATKSLKVDREKGIVKRVKIAQHGLNSNGTYFNEKFLSDLVKEGTEQKQGVKARFGHPNMCGTALGTYSGRYKNWSYEDGAAYADLHLAEVSKKAQIPNGGASIWEYTLDMAEQNPDMFGNSIHIKGFAEPEDIEGETYEVMNLESLLASDLVDTPAATDQLFDYSDDLGVQITEILENAPEKFQERLFQAIDKNPNAIQQFMSKYKNYSESNKTDNNKNMKSQIQEFFDKKVEDFKAFKDSLFDKTETLPTGDQLVIETVDDEAPKVGDKATVGGAPAPDGEHKVESGVVYVTENGAITEIKEPEEEAEEVPEEGMSEQFKAMQLDQIKFQEQLDAQSKGIEKLTQFYSNSIEEITSKFSEQSEAQTLAFNEMSQKFETLAASVESPEVETLPSDTPPEPQKTFAEKRAEQRAAEKKAKESK